MQSMVFPIVEVPSKSSSHHVFDNSKWFLLAFSHLLGLVHGIELSVLFESYIHIVSQSSLHDFMLFGFFVDDHGIKHWFQIVTLVDSSKLDSIEVSL